VVNSKLSKVEASGSSCTLFARFFNQIVDKSECEDAGARREAFIYLTSREAWSPELRQVLYGHLDDEDEGIRALVLDELAERGEPGAVDLLIREITTHTVINEIFVLEAAEKLADSRLLPVLQELNERGAGEWQSWLDAAMEACARSNR
jgi:hypothetical protein